MAITKLVSNPCNSDDALRNLCNYIINPEKVGNSGITFSDVGFARIPLMKTSPKCRSFLARLPAGGHTTLWLACRITADLAAKICSKSRTEFQICFTLNIRRYVEFTFGKNIYTLISQSTLS